HRRSGAFGARLRLAPLRLIGGGGLRRLRRGSGRTPGGRRRLGAAFRRFGDRHGGEIDRFRRELDRRGFESIGDGGGGGWLLAARRDDLDSLGGRHALALALHRLVAAGAAATAAAAPVPGILFGLVVASVGSVRRRLYRLLRGGRLRGGRSGELDIGGA